MHKYLKPYNENDFESILLEMRSDPDVEIIHPNLIYYTNSIYDYKKDKIKFKTKTPISKEALAGCDWFKENDCFVRYSVMALAKKGADYTRHYPSRYPKFSLELISPIIKLPSEISYKINNEEIIMPLDKVLEIVNKRVYSLTESIFRVLNLGSYYSIDDSVKSLVEFLKDMSENYLWKDILERNENIALDNIKKEFSDEKFINFWISKNNIKKYQLACDHDSSDQFSTDGTWYNSVGTCKKCLLDVDSQSFDSDSCQDAFEIWQAALEANK